ncbi:FMN-binding glutamate synthase family protein [Rheinheimera sp. WS51]|uniref:FMN-binding glutamate synthase family protein n=1 Tax=Rheinheimera sp. WS51 TaxID=3425886 RepID=UPI003D8A6015
MRRAFVITSIVTLVIVGLISLIWQPILWSLLVIIPVIIRGIVDIFQRRHSLLRNYPVVGHGRWAMEFLRPFVRQYFFESETDGAPINRMHRSVIYQRAKGNLDSIPYGTKLDTQRVGYEWVGHSLAAKHHSAHNPPTKVVVGGPHCTQPYEASIFNISAMSFGALSNNAIRALNKGAALGGFYHNTGEGSVSDYHLEFGGDLVWQIGTGYFGCRDAQGNFAPEPFRQVATLPSIKMIEIKLSQGAKPGHGGILPADKNTNEIARIRLVEPNTQVDSPPSHSAFNTPIDMMHFIQQLRQLSGGKPVGIKLAIGRTSEFIALCKAMIETGFAPDFITVDGGEGGTGAAPLEFSNSVGMPLREALAFVCDVLVGFNLKKQIKVIASGKVFTGFNIVKNIAVGADICNSARGMMVALGCIQSLECHTNKCPTGVATQNPSLARGLVVETKAERVARYHKETVKASMEMIAAAGLRHMSELNRSHLFRRISETEVRRFDQIYTNLIPGSLLNGSAPDKFEQAMRESSAESFMPQQILERTKQGLTAIN